MTTETSPSEKRNLKKITAIMVWVGLIGFAFFAMAIGSLTPIDFIYDGI